MMTQDGEPTEHSPLLGGGPELDNFLDPGAPNGPLPTIDAILREPHSDGVANKAGDTDVEAEDDTAEPNDLHEGLPEVRTQLKYIMPAIALGVFLSASDQTIIFASAGKIGSDLDALNNVSWIATSYLMTQTCFQSLYGKLSDIFGRKPVLLFAYTMLGVGCLFCGLARNLGELVTARAVAGVGGAANTVVTIILSDIVPMRERGFWQAVTNLIFACGAGIGAPLGGILADRISWRWAFLGQAPLCALTIISLSLTLHLPNTATPDDWKTKLARVDFLGAILLVLAIFFLLLGLDRGGNVSWRTPLAVVSMALFQPLIGLFTLVEGKYAKEPLAPPRILFQRSLLATYLCLCFSIAAWYGVAFYLPLYYQAVDGMNSLFAGVKLLPALVAAVVGSLVGGYIMKKTGRYYWLSVGAYASMVVGIFTILLFTGLMINNDYGIWVGLILGGLGNGISLTTSLLALISNAETSDQAIVTACSYLFRSLGTVIGLSLISTLVQTSLRIQLLKRLSDTKDIGDIIRGVRQSLSYINTLPPETRELVKQAYEAAISSALVLMLAFAACALCCSWFVHEKKIVH